MLSVKSGWLVKRNEQHVWQKRWCCVVPHTFLYYFEAEPPMDEDEDATPEGGGVGGGMGPFIVLNQELLNAAVREGYNDRHGRNGSSYYSPFASSYGYAYQSYAHPSPRANDTGEGTPGAADVPVLDSTRAPMVDRGANLHPVGIIDLECYSNVNRSSKNDSVMEVTGDSITNPDLRSFYFQAATTEDADAWTTALLSDRHCALRDEREAYRQVCDSFPIQLQLCSDMIDAAEERASEAEKELYHVRSAAEEGRRKALELVRDILEQRCWGQVESRNPLSDSGSDASSAVFSGISSLGARSKENLRHRKEMYLQHRNKDRSDRQTEKPDARAESIEQQRCEFAGNLDQILRSPETAGAMHGGLLSGVQILAAYTSAIIAQYRNLCVEMKAAEHSLSTSAGIDKDAQSELEERLKASEKDRESDRLMHEDRAAALEVELDSCRSALVDSENQLQTSRMEFSMFQSQGKAKLGELAQHKKILKKEVIDLRKRIDEIGSERDAAEHRIDNLQRDLTSERGRNSVLERYIEKMENQVSLQQNMMEMMSQTASFNGSMTGKYIGPAGGNSSFDYGSGAGPTPPRPKPLSDSPLNELNQGQTVLATKGAISPQKRDDLVQDRTNPQQSFDVKGGGFLTSHNGEVRGASETLPLIQSVSSEELSTNHQQDVGIMTHECAEIVSSSTHDKYQVKAEDTDRMGKGKTSRNQEGIFKEHKISHEPSQMPSRSAIIGGKQDDAIGRNNVQLVAARDQSLVISPLQTEISEAASPLSSSPSPRNLLYPKESTYISRIPDALSLAPKSESATGMNQQPSSPASMDTPTTNVRWSALSPVPSERLGEEESLSNQGIVKVDTREVGSMPPLLSPGVELQQTPPAGKNQQLTSDILDPVHSNPNDKNEGQHSRSNPDRESGSMIEHSLDEKRSQTDDFPPTEDFEEHCGDDSCGDDSDPAVKAMKILARNKETFQRHQKETFSRPLSLCSSNHGSIEAAAQAVAEEEALTQLVAQTRVLGNASKEAVAVVKANDNHFDKRMRRYRRVMANRGGHHPYNHGRNVSNKNDDREEFQEREEDEATRKEGSALTVYMNDGLPNENEYKDRHRFLTPRGQIIPGSNDEDDYDGKSHISELTEDRTFKESFQRMKIITARSNETGSSGSPRNNRGSSHLRQVDKKAQPINNDTTQDNIQHQNDSNKLEYPPKFIIGATAEGENSGSSSQRGSQSQGRPPFAAPILATRKIADDASSTGSGYLSVAQRSRMEADTNNGGSIVIRAESPVPGTRKTMSFTTPSPARSTKSTGSGFFSSIGKKFAVAMDSSITSSFDESEEGIKRRGGSGVGSKRSVQMKADVNTPLHIRQQMQREKQLAFLREQGLIKDKGNVPGGPASTPVPSPTRTGSFSRTRSFGSQPGRT